VTRLIHHLRSNAIAYLALIVALGGTSYAAINLPANSVGTRQLKSGAVTTNKLANGSVTARKLDGKSIGGSVLHWARVGETGRILSGSRDARVSVSADEYTVDWQSRFSSRCAVVVTPAAVPGIATIAARIGVGLDESGHGTTRALVWTYNESGPARAPFNIVVVC
jgi:hypothetical protein